MLALSGDRPIGRDVGHGRLVGDTGRLVGDAHDVTWADVGRVDVPTGAAGVVDLDQPGCVCRERTGENRQPATDQREVVHGAGREARRRDEVAGREGDHRVRCNRRIVGHDRIGGRRACRAVARRVEGVDGVAVGAGGQVGVGEAERGAVDRGDQHREIGVGAQHTLAVDAVPGDADVVGRSVPSERDVASVDVGRRRRRQPGRRIWSRGVGNRGDVGCRRSRLCRVVAGSIERVNGVDVRVRASSPVSVYDGLLGRGDQHAVTEDAVAGHGDVVGRGRPRQVGEAGAGLGDQVGRHVRRGDVGLIKGPRRRMR